MNSVKRVIIFSMLLLSTAINVAAAVMNDYCIQPPFVSQTVPPLVLFNMERDHKLYFQAYNDATDLNGDGKIDYKYNHTINYYGYFDPFKCYTYTGTATNGEFTPVAVSSNKFCAAGQWGGNVLNWLSMTRMDVLKKVLYGGQRIDDSSTKTTLKRVYVPQDAHSWGKEMTGRLCYDGVSTYTTSCVTAADCATGQTCVDKSLQLIGIAAADAPSECPSTVTAPAWSTNGKMLVSKYSHSFDVCGTYDITSTVPPADCPECPPTVTIVDGILNSYEASPANLQSYFYSTGFDATAADDKDLQPYKNHGDHFNYFVTARFAVSNSDKGNWQFLVDSDDGAYVMVDGVIVSNYPGCHSRCHNVSAGKTPDSPATGKVCSGTIMGPTVKACATDANCNAGEGTCQTLSVCSDISKPLPQPGTISLTAGTHQLVVRHTEKTGDDGVRVWFRKGTSGAWQFFNATNLTLTAPTITETNKCSISSMAYIESGIPSVGTAKQHLFCNTTLAANGEPLLRYITNRAERAWQWSSMESGSGPSCGSKIYNNATDDKYSATSNITPTDMRVLVEVCKKEGVTGGFMDPDYEFERCKGYPDDAAVAASAKTFKPIGLLQKYGETKDGAKVCSKTMSKICANDSGCNLATEGLCVYKSDMYFGLFTTSFTKNKSGGVLRKNIGSILDETNFNNGILQTSENTAGNMIMTIDKLKIAEFDYGTLKYTGCQFNDRPMNEGECKDWGNPIGEMMYESLRYLAGKADPLAAFTYTTPADSGINLSKPAWGKFGTGSATYKPYDIYPTCAKPFILLLSDINSSFDDDQVPKSAFATSYTEDAGTPVLGIDAATLSDTIGTTEAIAAHDWFIGETTSLQNFICDSKPVTNLSTIRGICPEEPTKRGTFHAAAMAYFGKTLFKGKTGLPDVNTFSVALASPMADLKFKVDGKYITFVPVGKSVSSGSAEAKCGAKCTFSIDNSATGKGLTISNCAADAFCPTNAIVNTFIEDVRYDNDKNLIYARFRINYENYEQGLDFDMDALVRYEVCTAASVNKDYSFCTNALAANQIEIKVDSRAAAGGTDQALGFVISGSTADGSYLVVKDADVGATSRITTLPLSFQRTFTVSATGSSTGILKNPLWYAAKWGGFEDGNGDKKPDQLKEWAKNCTESDTTKCNPDNYYMVNNPLELERQLDQALRDILRRVSSGTAASILNNSEGSGANLLQAVFYPKKAFDNGSEANWIGELQNLWYFVDPMLQKTSIREDTNKDNRLNLKQDKVTQFYFDPTESQTLVKRFTDSDGDGAADTPSSPDDTVNPDLVNSLWKAGRMLWERNVSESTAANYDPRTIYTGLGSTSGSTPRKFSNLAIDGYYNTWPGVQDVLQIPAGTAAVRDAAAAALINYVHGIDQSGARSRKVTINGCGITDTQGCTREWKLGDIVSSTPKLVSNVKLNNYNMPTPNGYNDKSYNTFIASAPYPTRGMAFVGGNDGMLHAFKLGVLKELNDRTSRAQINNSSGNLATAADKLGREEWAFIPTNVMPYLKYLADPNYSHLFYVDRTPSIVDASIGKPATCAASTDYSACDKSEDGSTWKTVLIGGMGIGGASANSTGPCSNSTECVWNPILNYGFSSYFALDVTDPANPKYLWEFPDASLSSSAWGSLGYSTTGPALVRIANKDASGNPLHNKNGKWFAVFASGPTGPIDTTKHEFKGTSNQNLKLFIVDLATGSLITTIDTGVQNAFAGSLATSWIDIDRSDTSAKGHYSDDAVYIGYVQKDTSVTPNTWTKGGVIRLSTKESDDPASATAAKKWSTSTLISGIGPVSTSITKLQDRKNKQLWVYFGTGRFFYKTDDPSTTTTQKIYGVKEPCYSTTTRVERTPYTNLANSVADNKFDQLCTTSVTAADLTDQSGSAATAPAASLTATSPGWAITLDASSSTSYSERVITDPVASPAGAVFFTTFKPNSDICSYGGQSLIWAVNYASGGVPPANAMKGKALMQVSTGAFAELSLSTAFKNDGNARLDGRRLAVPITGVPPTAQGLSLIVNPPPVKKFLHVKEK